MSTSELLDVDALRRAIESADADAMAKLFAADATVVMIDQEHPPSRPQTIQGREAIRAMLDDICSRDMTHEVTHLVAGDSGVAYTEMCRYADGTRVEVAMLMDVRDGRITRQEGVQAWDTA
ncbi:nuclear transport factor 2 family protein [Conexibacter arvalis]|uniref:Ketosteroid isomerase-like protein n=1 Tax=Conexibacter arvalis TaxID=912552 RepID=A0A840IGD9_9ACTN|nr:nuclear transport factor 2 family protein [Conexibacter arvalis]MBB4664107.1 ketosteroid isomerase-like protein [Conexibacter arvalis]